MYRPQQAAGQPPLPEGEVGSVWDDYELIFALVMRDIPGNRRISPGRLPRALRSGEGRRECINGTYEDIAESAASWSRE